MPPTQDAWDRKWKWVERLGWGVVASVMLGYGGHRILSLHEATVTEQAATQRQLVEAMRQQAEAEKMQVESEKKQAEAMETQADVLDELRKEVKTNNEVMRAIVAELRNNT